MTDNFKLQKQVDYLEAHQKCSLCYTNCDIEFENHNISKKAIKEVGSLRRPKDFEDHLIHALYIAPMTWCYRADIAKQMGNFDKYTDDTFAMALDFFALGEVHYIDEVTAVYSSRSGSVTGQLDKKKYWNYIKGIFDTQIDYCDKYSVCPSFKQKVLSKGYLCFLPEAIEAEDTSFIESSNKYYLDNLGIDLTQYVGKIQNYVSSSIQYHKILNSKPYRIGRLILSPIKRVKRLFK